MAEEWNATVKLVKGPPKPPPKKPIDKFIEFLCKAGLGFLVFLYWKQCSGG